LTSEQTPSEKGIAYAQAVVAGEVPACEWVRLACKRHLDDLERAESGEWAYTFDAAAGDKVCRFIELLPHVKGKWAAKRERIILQPWQCWLTTALFGWKVAATGMRRFRSAYVALPRKNGKSLWAATVGLYLLAADGEVGAEVYSGATTEQQAWEVFRPAHHIAKQVPTGAKLCAAYGIEVNAKTLVVHKTGGRFQPVIGKPGDGASPSCAIVDEYHEHATAEHYDTMQTGMAAREQPLLLVITTAGVDTSSPCYSLQTDVQNVLHGLYQDESLFGVVYGIDPEDDWTTEAALIKANPNWGVSINPENVLAEQADAIRNANKSATFKCKHLNVWCGAREPYFNMEAWRAGGDTTLRREQFEGDGAFIGVDLASKVDIADVVTLFRRDIEGTAHYYAFARHYLPEDRIDDPALAHYAKWAAEGWMIATPGNIIDQQQILEDVRDEATLYGAQAVGYDPYGATMFATGLSAEGIPVVEVPQTVRHLSEPMKWVEAMVLAGRLHHNGDPVLTWMMGNVTARVDAKDNVFPRKERLDNKIDGAVALIIAMGRAMDAGVETRSVYEERGLLTI
jgi:phage terminase large subunit-like protein